MMHLIQDINVWFAGYMGTTVLSYVVLIWLSKREDKKYMDLSSGRDEIYHILSRSWPGVTILAAAKNEAKIISKSVKSLLDCTYPNLSVIVMDDGSTDSMMDILHREYVLKPMSVPKATLPHTKITAVWRSTIDPRLRVLQKRASVGSKGCGNNAALEITSDSIVFVTDVDSVIEPGTIEKMVSRLVYTGADAVGCPLRTMNSDGNYWELVQTLEYTRAFQFRQGWCSLGLLNNISGAAGLFKADSLRKIGGYRIDTTAEDLASTFNLLASGMKLAYEPTVNVYTQVPNTFKSLKSQRKRWSRGLFDTLWFSRQTIFSKFGLLWLWLFLFELIEPIVEIAGLISISITVIEGRTNPWFWFMMSLVVIMAASISIVCIFQREKMSKRMTPAEKAKFILIAPIELLPFKIPLTLFWRMTGIIEYLNGETGWKLLERQQINVRT